MQYNAPFGSVDPTAGYLNGNPQAGIAGSIPPAAAIELTQREIVNCIVAAGLTPNNLDPTQLMQAVRGGALSYIGDGGTANQLLVNPNPAYISYFVGMTLSVKPAYANTGPSTINVNSLATIPVVKKGGQPCSGGEWSQGDIIQLQYNGTAFQIIGGGASSGGASFNSWVQNKAGSTYTYVVPQGVNYILVSVWGGGGGGAGVQSYNDFYATPCGGGGGGFTQALLKVTGGQVITVVVGAGAPRTTAGQYAGAAGGTSSFLGLVSTGGGGASLTIGPTPGGVGSGGTLNLVGGVGRGGFFANGGTPCGGDGGSSWCSGPVPFSSGKQHDGEQPGQGGSGASSPSGAPVAGGAGKDGMVTVVCVG